MRRNNVQIYRTFKEARKFKKELKAQGWKSKINPIRWEDRSLAIKMYEVRWTEIIAA